MEENNISASGASSQEAVRKARKEKIGYVVSDKMNKSIVVAIEYKEQHLVYKKYLKKTTKIMAHDEKNEAKVGDRVSVREARPLSRRKSWRLAAIIEKAK